ncbi:hypothetical protein [Streptomyces gibsoniae]|uniref:Secreted protein n=1 Tax=Streptomyces gibsoniae TaxID=3075529 RepID=A0ABU2U6Y4_9ACTN|nr:hypothetical protein [Streptomyces sp. DSM 41699]MDT0468997.1 hypothetical protein [Streptomyces sp. DSM 41699]
MARKNLTQSSRTSRREHARRWKRSKVSLALIGGPVILAVVAGSVFAAEDPDQHRPQRNQGAVAQPAAAGKPDPNCTLLVPDNPLTVSGLATPYRLIATDPAQGPCHEANPDQSAFVEAAIVTPNGKLTVYNPLVIDKGTKPAARTARPSVPRGSTVGIWFGFNSANLTLRTSGRPDGLAQGKCVNGLQGSVFGQFAYCNAPAFFRAANAQIAKGHLRIPGLGTAKDGLPCPTTRDFSVVDQDGSDNVVTHYLADARGRIAQNNAASRAALKKAARLANRGDRHHRHNGRGKWATTSAPKDLANGSDNLLLTQFMDPALGCKPFTAPDQSSDGQATPALALDELSAAADQKAPIALVPQNDPMTLVDGRGSVAKTNAYRIGVNMPAVGAGADSDGAAFCTTLFRDQAGIQRVFKDKALFEKAPSPDPSMAPNLFGFLAARANQTFTNLGCDKLLGAADPVTLTTNTDGLVTDSVLTALGQTPPSAAPMASTSPSASPSTPSAGTSASPTTATTSATSLTSASASPKAQQSHAGHRSGS